MSALTWKQHIDCISTSISRNIGVMNKPKYSMPGRVLHIGLPYCTLITPYLNYGILTCSGTCKSYNFKWNIKTITNSQYRSHTGPFFCKK